MRGSFRRSEKEIVSKQYQLTVTAEQAQVLSDACELMARLRIGQFYDIVWKVFPETLGSEKIDHEFVRGLFDRIAFELRDKPGHSGSDADWSEPCKVAWDLHQVVRHRLAWDKTPEGNSMNVHFDEPMPRGLGKLAQIENVEGETK